MYIETYETSSKWTLYRITQILSNWIPVYKLFAGWEVRIVKNFDRGLENAARPQAEGSIFKSEVKVFNSSDPISISNLSLCPRYSSVTVLTVKLFGKI